MFIKATSYRRLTNSLFSTTFLFAFGVVSFSSLLECPVNLSMANDTAESNKVKLQAALEKLDQQNNNSNILQSNIFNSRILDYIQK